MLTDKNEIKRRADKHERWLYDTYNGVWMCRCGNYINLSQSHCIECDMKRNETEYGRRYEEGLGN